MLGVKSSVRQRSDKSRPSRRRRKRKCKYGPARQLSGAGVEVFTQLHGRCLLIRFDVDVLQELVGDSLQRILRPRLKPAATATPPDEKPALSSHSPPPTRRCRLAITSLTTRVASIPYKPWSKCCIIKVGLRKKAFNP